MNVLEDHCIHGDYQNFLEKSKFFLIFLHKFRTSKLQSLITYRLI